MGFCSSHTAEYSEEDYDDTTVKQMLAPRSQETDTTEILNNLLKEYDKKLRPDIGGEAQNLQIIPCLSNCVIIEGVTPTANACFRTKENQNLKMIKQLQI